MAQILETGRTMYEVGRIDGPGSLFLDFLTMKLYLDKLGTRLAKGEIKVLGPQPGYRYVIDFADGARTGQYGLKHDAGLAHKQPAKKTGDGWNNGIRVTQTV